MIIVRYADDVVVGFEHESDALRFWDAMHKRLEEFSLSLHPDKTRLIEFGRHAAEGRAQRGLGKPETFKFLGFVFICGRTRKGKFQLKRKSRRDRGFKPPQAAVAERFMVVSVDGKGRARPCQVWIKKVSDKLTNVSVETSLVVSKLGSLPCSKTSLGEVLLTAQTAPGVELARA